MEALRAAGVVAARAGLDVAHVDNVAEQLALPGLRQRRADMRAETEVDARHVVGGVALARDAAQQQEAAAEAQFVAQAAEEPAERGQREACPG